jgi:hypothetical protein
MKLSKSTITMALLAAPQPAHRAIEPLMEAVDEFIEGASTRRTRRWRGATVSALAKAELVPRQAIRRCSAVGFPIR